MYTCRICYEDEKDRDKFIVPCKCDGSIKYICKECFNKILESDKNNSNYNICTICNTRYKRDMPKHDVSSEVLRDALYSLCEIIILIFFLISFCELMPCAIIFFIFYIISMYFIISNFGSNDCLLSILLIYYYYILSTGCKSIHGNVFGILLFCGFSYNLLNSSWKHIEEIKLAKLIQNIKSRIYDFDLNIYTDI